MKIYLDTANLEEIKRALDLGICDGVTTNPTLLAREKTSGTELLATICDLVPLKAKVSAEVVATRYEDMISEGLALYEINKKKIVIKIPICEEGLKAIRWFENEAIPNIATNATLCFSPTQALLVAKAGGSYVSPFVGRLDDIGAEGMKLVADIKSIYNNYNGLDTKIIVASIRNPNHVILSAQLGADIVTIPFSILKKLIHHPLTTLGIQRFLDDYKKIPI